MPFNFNIPQTIFFRYLQVHMYVKVNFFSDKSTGYLGGLMSEHRSSGWGSGVCTLWKYSKGCLSVIPICVEGKELGINFSDTSWHRLRMFASVLCQHIPRFRHQMCIRCRRDSTNFSNMFLLCPKLTSLWRGIFKAFSFYLQYDHWSQPNDCIVLCSPASKIGNATLSWRYSILDFTCQVSDT